MIQFLGGVPSNACLDLRSLDISLYFSDQPANSSTEIYKTTMEHSFEPLKNDLLLRAAWGGLPA